MEELPLDFGDERGVGTASGNVSSSVDASRGTPAEQAEPPAMTLPENHLVDCITGDMIPDTAKERVRQRIALALFREYGITRANMERDFPVPVIAEDSGKVRRKRADIAIFTSESEHTVENLRRIVICKGEPKNGHTVTKIRTPEQANRDLQDLKDLLGDERTPDRKYGMWTDGIDLFFLEKLAGRFGATYVSIADWPQADETVESRSGSSRAALRRADPEMLKITFRRCHNFIHGNEGMPKDAAFWQFLYLLFAKMHDERIVRERKVPPRFFAGLHEPFNGESQQIAQRVRDLFTDVKDEYEQFGPRDELTLSDRALVFLVSELAPYDLTHTDIDAKGLAYQELVGDNLRGDRGQYFTPRSAVELAVRILAPGDDEVVLDPACGTGGFLRETLRYRLKQWQANEGTTGRPDTEAQLIEHTERLERYADRCIFGADFDPFLVRATRMSIMMVAGIEGSVFHLDSLAFPGGHLDGVAAARERIPLGTIDVLMTNPPFGTDIKITDPDVLAHYRDGVAQPWVRDRVTGRTVPSITGTVTGMSPEQLFIQRAVEWVKPGGRIGIVLPNGILSNPGPVDEAIRRWILDNCWVLASIELPMETFVAEAGVNIITTLLFLQRKTVMQIEAAAIGGPPDYPIFMAIAEKVGFDRRGNAVYRRGPDGEEMLVESTDTVEARVGGEKRTITLTRKEKVLDNDLPEIARRYWEFRERHGMPGDPKAQGTIT